MPLPLEGRVLVKKFRFERLLGQGGMASVWLATNENVGKRVAIKLLRPEVTRDGEAVARFTAEARAAAKIGSDHIVDVFDSGASPVGPFIVMEPLTGRDLAEVIADEGPLPAGRAVSIALGVLAALGAAHRAGIVHRDLKPGNIFLHQLSPDRVVVKVMDFGVSKFLDGSVEATTRDGILLGTPEYMAPEALRGASKLDHRADVFSVGAVLYRALSGRQVFSGPDLQAVVARMANSDPTPLAELVEGLPEGLAEIVDRCLERDPDLRFQTTEALGAALTPFADESSLLEILDKPTKQGSTSRGKIASARPSSQSSVTPRPRRGAVAVWAGVAGLAATLGVGAWLAVNGVRPAAEGEADKDASQAQATADESPPSGIATAHQPLPNPEDTGQALVVPSPHDGQEGELPNVHDDDDGAVAEPDPEFVAPEPAPGTSGVPDTIEDDDDGGEDPDAEEASSEPDFTDPEPSDEPTTSDPEPLPPTPAGTVRAGVYLTPTKTPPLTDYAGARSYCAQLAKQGHLGMTNWDLANPAEAKRFVNSSVRLARYWTSALWEGKGIAYRLPSGRKYKPAATKRFARPLCVAKG